jgi:hypothetical protein
MNIPPNAVPTSVYVQPETIGIRPTIIPERFISMPKLAGQYYFPEGISLNNIPTRIPEIPSKMIVNEVVSSDVSELVSQDLPNRVVTQTKVLELPSDVPTRIPELPRKTTKIVESRRSDLPERIPELPRRSLIKSNNVLEIDEVAEVPELPRRSLEISEISEIANISEVPTRIPELPRRSLEISEISEIPRSKSLFERQRDLEQTARLSSKPKELERSKSLFERQKELEQSSRQRSLPKTNISVTRRPRETIRITEEIETLEEPSVRLPTKPRKVIRRANF